jgi:Mg2+-importing ATPase
VGTALVVALSVAVLRFSEAQEIARLAERAKPSWLLLAIVLQACTYVAQGEIWRGIGRAAQFPLSRVVAFKVSIAKLFVDQALPSGGISGSAAVARYLEDRGMLKPAIMAGVVVNIASYFAVYVLLLLVALLLLSLPAPAGKAMILGSTVFIVCSVMLVIALLVLPGHATSRIARYLARLRPLKNLLGPIEEADVTLVRKPRLLVEACISQLAIVLLDAATVWVLIEALGADASAVAVFASFMISNLFRTIGILPGGLGTFEASSVLTLGLVGVPLPVALSATLLFRGLSFWLPMLPGMWFSQRLFRRRSHDVDHAGVDAYWVLAPEKPLQKWQSSPEGLPSAQATGRLRRFDPNQLREERPLSRLRMLLRQVASPLLLLLVFAAVVAVVRGKSRSGGRDVARGR